MYRFDKTKSLVALVAVSLVCLSVFSSTTRAEDLDIVIYEESDLEQISLALQLIEGCVTDPDEVNTYEYAQLVGAEELPEAVSEIAPLISGSNCRMMPSAIHRYGDGYAAEMILIFDSGEGLIIDTVQFVFNSSGSAASAASQRVSLRNADRSWGQVREFANEVADMRDKSATNQAAASTTPLDIGDGVSANLRRQKLMYNGSQGTVDVLDKETRVETEVGTLDMSHVFDRPHGVAAFRYYGYPMRSFDVLLCTDANWDRVIVSGQYGTNAQPDTPFIKSFCSNGMGSWGLRCPTGVSWSGFDFFVADAYNNRIQQYRLNVAGSPPTPIYQNTIESDFDTPVDVAADLFDVEDFQYTCLSIVDQGNNRIVTLTPDGYTPYDNLGLDGPSSTCFGRNRVTHEPTQLVYVTDAGNRRVVAFYMQYPYPKPLTVFETPDGIFPEDAFLSSVDVDNYGWVYVMDATHSTIYKFSPGLEDFLGKFGSVGTGSGQLLYPNRLSFVRGERDYYNGPWGILNTGECIVTERFGTASGVRRFVAGFDVLAREFSYSPKLTTYPYDYVTYRCHVTGHTKSGLKIKTLDGTVVYDSEVKLRNPGELSFIPYFIPDTTALSTTFIAELSLQAAYDVSQVVTLYDTLEVLRVTVVPSGCTGCPTIVDNMQFWTPDGCFYADADRWYKFSFDLLDRCTGDPYSGRYAIYYYPTIAGTEFLEDTMLAVLWPAYFGHGDPTLSTRATSVYFRTPFFPSNWAGPYSYTGPCGVFISVFGESSGQSGTDKNVLQAALSPETTDSCGFVTGHSQYFYESVEETNCYVPLDPPDPDPGGCPFLYFWDGAKYRFANNLLPQAEGLSETDLDAVDYNPIFWCSPVDTFFYKFLITEEEKEVSQIDEFELLAYDIPYERGNLRFNNDRELIYLADSICPVSAVTNDGVDVTDLLRARDGKCFEASKAGWAEVVYNVSSVDWNAAASPERIDTGVIGTDPNDKDPVEKIAADVTDEARGVYEILLTDDLGSWQTVDKIYPRLRTEKRFVSVPAVTTKGYLKVRLAWSGTARIDDLFYYSVSKPEATPVKLELVDARHTGDGIVSSRLDNSDDLRQALMPGDSIELTYRTATSPEGVRRVFLFGAKGKYRSLTDSELAGLTDPTVSAISFDDPYPNPFNPVTTFNFALPQSTHVTLEVYNILGQKVVTLTDREYPAGRHAVEWDTQATGGHEVASGVYFARIKAGEYESSKKMVVVK